jgi:hypothetical protein
MGEATLDEAAVDEAAVDEAVLAALKKWPGVPDVYDWLELDLRGRYRLRTRSGETAAFEPVTNAALNAFIGRNYQPDHNGCWFFQNGPQRVFVRLALTPWVFRLHGQAAPVAHTGRPCDKVFGLVMDDEATPVLLTDIGPGLIDDRDLAQLQDLLREAGGAALDDAAFERWLEKPDEEGICLAWQGQQLPIRAIARDHLGALLGFDPAPTPTGVAGVQASA